MISRLIGGRHHGREFNFKYIMPRITIPYFGDHGYVEQDYLFQHERNGMAIYRLELWAKEKSESL